ncbi:MAG: hypothetical protein JO058_13890 [Alphaproteobacteria bacterium]|nr:hypothetical protein [Alphaproteobacteria bacterium]MBV9153302.1 hypothetical protein [Alphaproteobacteria bacterium]
MAVGPDGFVATSVAPDYAPQLLLTEYLRERQNVGDKALADALPRLRKALKKPELARLIGAIHTRIAWIAEHEAELSEPFRWQTFLAQLARTCIRRAYPSKKPI